MPDPWTEELAEAMATLPSAPVYNTLEFQHQEFLAPQRIVQDFDGGGETKDFLIEDTALLNPAEMVPFIRCAFEAELPEFGVGRVAESAVKIDGVARLMTEPLLAASEIQASLTMILRQYIDPAEEPAYGPVEYTIRNVRIAGTMITGLARINTMATNKFPSRVHTIKEFPGLLPG